MLAGSNLGMNQTNPKAFVFVLMPFGEEYRSVYEDGIKPACKDAGAYCERVDEQIFLENILERVYNQIAKADIIVAEMTGRNPNVFYEAGYAHALNKRVILLTKDASDIPFDLKHYPHVVYGDSISSLKSQLEARVRWCVENPKESLSQVEFNLDLYISGQPCRDEITLHSGCRDENDLWSTPIRLDFHNPSNHVYVGGATVTIITPDIFERSSLKNQSIALPDNKVLHTVGEFGKVFPNGWASFYCDLYSPKWREESEVKRLHQIDVRIYTEVGIKEYALELQNW